MTFDYESHKFKSTNKSVCDKNKENASSYSYIICITCIILIVCILCICLGVM